MKVFGRWIAAAALLAACSTQALAHPNLSVAVAIAPPVPMVEVVSPPRAGLVWAPGYWAWHRDGYIWIRGRWIAARPGHAWVADQWVPAGPRWHFRPGYWERPRHGRGHAYGHYRP